MPIVIKDVEWNQTENVVIIKVPLRGVHHSKVDIFYCPFYLKASFEYFIFEAFLWRPITPKESKCTFTETHAIFELVKENPQTWEKLEVELKKAERQELKLRYIEEERQRLEKESEKMKNKKSELKRLAVREQMALDTKNRENIERIKHNEKKNALQQMEMWCEKEKQEEESGEESDNAINEKHSRFEETLFNSFNFSKTNKNESLIPAPRTAATLHVEFTPREFPTPCRESRLEEEDEWLRKQAEARRSVGFISEDLRPEEHNPHYLKCKGDEFLTSKNFLAAISAYSFGIKLNNKFADLYVGRAKAHFSLGNYNKTIKDCSTAIDLLKPEVPANLSERAVCIGMRGVSLVNLGLVKEGIGEIKASLNLVPNEDFSEKLEEATEKLSEINT